MSLAVSAKEMNRPSGGSGSHMRALVHATPEARGVDDVRREALGERESGDVEESASLVER